MKAKIVQAPGVSPASGSRPGDGSRCGLVTPISTSVLHPVAFCMFAVFSLLSLAQAGMGGQTVSLTGLHSNWDN
jgi:hypothetical protein